MCTCVGGKGTERKMGEKKIKEHEGGEGGRENERVAEKQRNKMKRAREREREKSVCYLLNGDAHFEFSTILMTLITAQWLVITSYNALNPCHRRTVKLFTRAVESSPPILLITRINIKGCCKKRSD